MLFTLAQDYLPEVMKKWRAGQILPVEAWDRDLKTKLAIGKLLTIDNTIDPSTGTARFKAEFPNDDNALFPNQFVNARLLVDTRRGAVMVPVAAVQRSPQSAFRLCGEGRPDGRNASRRPRVPSKATMPRSIRVCRPARSW